MTNMLALSVNGGNLVSHLVVIGVQIYIDTKGCEISMINSLQTSYEKGLRFSTGLL